MRPPPPASLVAAALILPAVIAALFAFAGTGMAQVNNEFPGASSGQFAPPAPPAPTPGPAVQPYPNTESFARDRIQSQGYKVQRIERQVDGSWKADANRARPLESPPPQRRVPTKITIFPDGRMVEEY